MLTGTLGHSVVTVFGLSCAIAGREQGEHCDGCARLAEASQPACFAQEPAAAIDTRQNVAQQAIQEAEKVGVGEHAASTRPLFHSCLVPPPCYGSAVCRIQTLTGRLGME
jgi:hypothetical protein